MSAKDLRDELAMAALTGILANSWEYATEEVCGEAYKYADVMMVERARALPEQHRPKPLEADQRKNFKCVTLLKARRSTIGGCLPQEHFRWLRCWLEL